MEQLWSMPRMTGLSHRRSRTGKHIPAKRWGHEHFQWGYSRPLLFRLFVRSPSEAAWSYDVPYSPCVLNRIRLQNFKSHANTEVDARKVRRHLCRVTTPCRSKTPGQALLFSLRDIFTFPEFATCCLTIVGSTYLLATIKTS